MVEIEKTGWVWKGGIWQKWIFQFFKGIGVLKIESGGITKTIITNLTNIHKKIISFFGKIALDIYGLLNHEELQKLEERKLQLN